MMHDLPVFLRSDGLILRIGQLVVLESGESAAISAIQIRADFSAVVVSIILLEGNETPNLSSNSFVLEVSDFKKELQQEVNQMSKKSKLSS